MARRRSAANSIYPDGVYPSKGWLFWRDRATKKWHKLGKSWDKAAREKWLELSTGKSTPGTVAELLDDVIKHREQLVRQRELAARTYEDNLEYARYLKLAFGRMPAHTLNSRHATAYLQQRTWQPRPRKGPDGELIPQAPRRAPVRANKELSLLSAAYTWAMSSPAWPQITSNPCYGVERNPERRKERCPERWEIEAAKQKAPPMWALIFDFAYVCGQRGIDTRLLPRKALQADGIHMKQTKTGAEVVIEWSDELYAIVLGLLAWSDEIQRPRKIESPYVISARSGGPYTPHGWKTTVYKIVRAAIADPENPLEVPFSFHDLRARSATDEEELEGTNPQHRLGHARRSTTDIYMRGKRTKRVKPLSLKRA